MFLLCKPALFAENTTFIFADLPGLIGSVGFSGTVQPQDALASIITKSTVPSFLISNSTSPLDPFLIRQNHVLFR